MKTFILLVSAFCFSISAFSQSAALAADLQSADAAHWPAINELLIAQRNELNAAHLAALATASAQIAALTTERDTKAAENAALKQRIADVLTTQLTEEMKTGDGPRAALLRDLIAQAGKTDAQLKLEAAQAAEAAAIAARKEAEAAVK